MSLSLAWGIDDNVKINGNIYALDLEFSKVLRWYEMLKDESLSEEYRLFLSIIMIVDIDWEQPPRNYGELLKYIAEEDIEELSAMIIDRIVGDNVSSTTVEKDINGNILSDEEHQYYDFEEDSGYIYASFLMDYHIDLIEAREKGSLHWDKFNHLLSGLSEQTKFKKVIEIRAMDIPHDASLERKEEIRKAKAAVALKRYRKQIEFDMMDLKQKREYAQKQNMK